MKEIWLEIKEWEGYYISNKGRVKNKDGIRKLWVNKYRNNYVSVFHTRGEKISPPMFKIHRLVAKYFIPNPQNKPQVNHIDNDPQNNHVSNLEWVTPKENIAHMIKQNRQIWLKGEQCKQSILTEKTVKSIFSLKGKHPYKEIAKMFNTNYSNVAHIMRGSRWQHITNPNLELLTPDLIDTNAIAR